MAVNKESLSAQIGYTTRDAGKYPEQEKKTSVEPFQVAALGSTAAKIFSQTRKIKTNDIKPAPADVAPKITPAELDDILLRMEQESQAMPDPDAPPMEEMTTEMAPEGMPPEDVIPEEGGLPPEDIDTDALLNDYMNTESPDPVADKLTDERNINIQRQHQGGMANPKLDQMDEATAIREMETADDIAKLLTVVGSRANLKEGPRSHAELDARTQNMDQVREELKDVFGGNEKQLGLMSDVQLVGVRKMVSTAGVKVTELANKIAAGDKTPAVLLEYQQSAETFVALQRFLQGQVKEVARALSSQRLIATTLDGGTINDITRLIHNGQMTPEGIAAQANNVAKRIEENPETGLSEAFKTKRWRDTVSVMAEFWTNNILSGTSTHAVNMTGNTAVNIWEAVILKPLAATIGETRKGLNIGRQDDYVSGDEALVNITSSYMGLRDGFRAMGKALKTGESSYSGSKGEEVKGSMTRVFGDTGQEWGGETGRKIGEGIATASTLSFRALQAEDDLFKTLALRQELTSLAVRSGKGKGLEGQELADHVADTLNNPSDEMFTAAQDKAAESTFTNTGESNEWWGFPSYLAGAAKKFTSEYPALKFVFPFINTPTNLITYTLNSTALAPFNPKLVAQLKKGGAEGDVALAKMVAGVSMSALVYAAYDAGNITGSGPENYKQRKLLESTGWLPNAIRIGDDYYQYKRMDPFAGAIAAMADQFDRAKYASTEVDATDAFLGAALGIADHTLNATYMQGMNDLLGAVDEKGLTAKKFLANYASGFIPYSGTAKTIGKLVDGRPTRVLDDKNFETGYMQQVGQKLQQTIPGMSKNLQPQRYWDGRVAMPEQGRMAYAMSPFKTSTLKSDPTANAIFTNDAAPAEPSPMISKYGISFSLLSFDDGQGKVYDRYLEKVGERRREYVEKLISTSAYKKMDKGPDSEGQAAIKQQLSKAVTSYTTYFLQKELPALAEEFPDLLENEQYLTITDSLSDFYKDARGGNLPEDMPVKVNKQGELGGLETPVPNNKVEF